MHNNWSTTKINVISILNSLHRAPVLCQMTPSSNKNFAFSSPSGQHCSPCTTKITSSWPRKICLRGVKMISVKIAISQRYPWRSTVTSGTTHSCCWYASLTHTLQSAATNHIVALCYKLSTIGSRALPFAATRIRNALPDNVVSASSVDLYRRQLKTFVPATFLVLALELEVVFIT